MKYGVLGKINRVHLVGIGGAGMNAIARVLVKHGISVCGSDINTSETTTRLKQEGITVFNKHHPNHVKNAQLVAYSSAINAHENPEVIQAKKMRIPAIKRDQLLGEMMRLKTGICIAGSHGKTTTATMVGVILSECGVDPTVLIGGYSDYFSGSATVGKSEFMVIESDEYDRAFLKLTPTISIITSIDSEHLDTYKGGIDEISQAFVTFAEKTPFFGKIIGCTDNAQVKALLTKIDRPFLTYGIEKSAQLRADNIKTERFQTKFSVALNKKHLGYINLNAVGNHNIQNSLAAIGASLEIGLSFDNIAQAIKKFFPVRRRFQVIYNNTSVIIDDYAHHPVEVSQTIETARCIYPNKKIVSVLQPHLFSRTKAMYKEFATALSKSDLTIVSDIFPSREAQNDFPGVSNKLILKEIKKGCKECRECTKGTLLDMLLRLHQQDPESIFILMGAGDITKTAKSFSKKLRDNVLV